MEGREAVFLPFRGRGLYSLSNCRICIKTLFWRVGRLSFSPSGDGGCIHCQICILYYYVPLCLRAFSVFTIASLPIASLPFCINCQIAELSNLYSAFIVHCPSSIVHRLLPSFLLRDQQKSVCDERKRLRDERKRPRDERKLPRDEQKLPREQPKRSKTASEAQRLTKEG